MAYVADHSCKFWPYGRIESDFWRHFHSKCAKLAIYKLPVKFLKLPFDSSTPISLLIAKFWWFRDAFHCFLHFKCWKSAIFLLPACLTYWLRKYTMHRPRHQVWNWYDHPLPSYSIFAANMLRDLDLLTMSSRCCTWWVTDLYKIWNASAKWVS